MMTLGDAKREYVRLSTKEVALGEPHISVPDLSDKVVLVVGATYPSGFGYNFGKVAAAEGGAQVMLTASTEKGCKRLKKHASAFGATTAICDVTDAASIAALKHTMGEIYGHVDAIVVAPSFLKTDYFAPDKTWADVTEQDKEDCRKVTVYAVREVARAFGNLLSDTGVVYGVSFSLLDLPGYTIGPAKKELEEMVTTQLASEINARANILLLGPFRSVSSLVVPGEALMRKVIAEFGIPLPSIGRMVRDSVATIASTESGHIYEFDDGLRRAAAKNPEKLNRLYAEYTA